MISLEEDIRTSDDDLDTILKRHNTNLYEIFHGTKKKPDYKVEGSEYEQFKEYYYNHLDMGTEDIKRVVGLNTHRYQEHLKRGIKETGLKRKGHGFGGTKLVEVE